LVSVVDKQHDSASHHPALPMLVEQEIFEPLRNEEITSALMEMIDLLFMCCKILAQTLLRDSLADCTEKRRREA
jgi:hypothetical protein